MERPDSRIAHPHEASTDERASSSHPGAEAPADPPLLSDCLGDVLAESLADSFTSGGRKPRHDGFTPEKMAIFLRQLAASGVVDHAARAAGVSTTAAYNMRNRREGRAFASMWDAVLVNRARSRLASELQSRAVAGCVSVRKRDGVVVGEYHYYDNRLAMALLTRLDRLAEKEAASEAHLRALSEDLDDFIDCLAQGGDADAFVDERRPAASAPEAGPSPAAPPEGPEQAERNAGPGADDDRQLTAFARMADCPDYLDVSPFDIEVRDLDAGDRSEWSADQWVRAYRSGFMAWLGIRGEDALSSSPRRGAAIEYFFLREASRAAAELPVDKVPVAPGDDEAPLVLADIRGWSDRQLARAWRGGLLHELPGSFWEGIADDEAGGRNQD